MIIKKIVNDVKKTNSVILRVFLLINFLGIYFYNENALEKSVYILSFFLYPFFLIINLIFNNVHKNILRLVIDLIFITIFLYFKDLDNILNFFPLILLVYNAPSHSGTKNKKVLFVFFIHLTVLVIDQFAFKTIHHLVLIALYIFFLIQSIVKSLNDINEEILSLVGNLYIESVQDNDNNNHRILVEVKDKLNNSSLKTINTIKDIFLFVRIKQQLVLIKGSKFIINNDIKSKIFNNIENYERNRLYKEQVIIDNNNYETSYWMNCKVDKENDYYFLICFSKESLFNETILNNMAPIFSYIARIYFMSNKSIVISNTYLKTIKQKITYVFDAQNAIHYVRNKLSPITSTISLIDRYFKDTELSDQKKLYIQKRLKENNNNIQIKEILDKAEILINGVDNVISEEDDNISLKNLIDNLRRNWIYYYNNTDGIVISISDLSNRYLKINQMLFEFVFTDIIENMRKYSEDSIGTVNITLVDDRIVMTFSNGIRDYEKNKKNINDIANLYNLKDNDEIYNRKTHGLNFIRRLLKKKKIINNIFINQDLKTFNFEIQLNLINYENTDI